MIFISGMHRSGTTFVGKLLESSRKFHCIHEPFNYQYGIQDIPSWYPKINSLNKKNSTDLARSIQDVFAYQFKFKAPKEVNEPFYKFLFRKIVKSKGNIDLVRFNLFRRSRKPIIKDPFIVLSAHYILNKYKETKFIFIVRHPVPLYKSMIRMNWSFDMEGFLAVNDIPELKIKWDATNKSEVEAFCILWNYINQEILRLSISNKDQVLLILHEKLSLNPDLTAKTLFSFLDESVNSRVFDFLNDKMRSETINPKGSNQHVFSRNSAQLATKWRNENIPNKDIILNMCSALINEFKLE